MAPPSKQPPIRSPLLSALNSVVNTKRSNFQIRSTKNSLDDFLRFMNVEVASLQAQKLPDQKKISKLSNLNMASTFGRPGSLLSSLASGAMDVAGFLGEFFRGKRKPPRPNSKPGKPIPKSKGVRLGGLRAAGIVNAVFAGLDFKEGLDQGESTSLAAAGAGGALAGSLLGGALGQALIPVPGWGFMIGSMAGNFLGGYTADRIHESVTGERSLREKQDQKLKSLEAEQKSSAATSTTTFPQVLDKFETVVYQFSNLMSGSTTVSPTSSSESFNDRVEEEYHQGELPEPQNNNTMTGGDLGEYTVEGGTAPSSKRGSRYGMRKGRMHWGIDYPVNVGTPISVIQPGTINFAGLDSKGNLSVYVDHPDGSQTRYLHLSELKVSQGQQIEPGTLIGLSGGEKGAYGSGNSTGPHLHFEYCGPNGGGSMDPAVGGMDDKSFRFGGNITVKAKPNTGTAAPGAGGPTLVIAAGTNNFGVSNTSSAEAALKRTIQAAQAKGYNVVYIPPNSEGEFATISKALSRVATQSGAKIETARYGTGGRQERAHFAAGEADRIRQAYPGATFMGDSNAAGLAGGQRPGMAVDSQTMETIEGYARNLKPVSRDRRSQAAARRREMQASTSQVQPVQQQPVAPQQVSTYTEYNRPTTQVTTVLVTSTPPAGGGSTKSSPPPSYPSAGGQSQVAPFLSKNRVLNSLFSTALLTNLSGT